MRGQAAHSTATEAPRARSPVYSRSMQRSLPRLAPPPRRHSRPRSVSCREPCSRRRVDELQPARRGHRRGPQRPALLEPGRDWRGRRDHRLAASRRRLAPRGLLDPGHRLRDGAPLRAHRRRARRGRRARRALSPARVRACRSLSPLRSLPRPRRRDRRRREGLSRRRHRLLRLRSRPLHREQRAPRADLRVRAPALKLPSNTPFQILHLGAPSALSSDSASLDLAKRLYVVRIEQARELLVGEAARLRHRHREGPLQIGLEPRATSAMRLDHP